MFDKTKPMNLGDIFNITINLIKETFLRNLIIAVIFFIPTGIILSVGFDYFFSMIMNIVQSSIQHGASQADLNYFGDIFSAIFIYGLVILALTLSTLGVMIGVTFTGCTTMNGKKVSISDVLQKIFSITFLRVIGQSVLLVLVFCTMMGLPIILIILSGVNHLAILTFFSVLLLIAAMFCMVYFYIKWYFALTAIVCDDLPIIDSFRKSFALVKNYWWRTLGLIILISITVQFAISLVTTPISFIVLWDLFAEYFKLIAGGNFNQDDPSKILSIMSSFGYSLGIIITISSILQYSIAPLFNVSLYYDLKIRKNDFKEDTNTENEAPTIV